MAKVSMQTVTKITLQNFAEKQRDIEARLGWEGLTDEDTQQQLIGHIRTYLEDATCVSNISVAISQEEPRGSVSWRHTEEGYRIGVRRGDLYIQITT